MLIGNRLSAADKRRLAMLYANNQGGNLRQQLLDGAPFLAELTHTAVPQRAAPGTVGTFTRATTSTWQNNDGYQVTGVAGEIGFVGARRVRNLIPTTSENLSNAAWTKQSATISGTNTIVEAAATSIHRVVIGGSPTPSAGVFCASVDVTAGTRRYVVLGIVSSTSEIWAAVDTQTWTITQTGNAVNGTYIASSLTANADGTYRLSVIGSLSITGAAINYGGSATGTPGAATPSYLGDGSTFIGNKFQLENITGRADQTTPSEYVSVGVPADWAGDELVTNGTFDTDTTGWSSGRDLVSWSSGMAKATSDAADGAFFGTAISVVSGVKYVISTEAMSDGVSVAARTYLGTGIGTSDIAAGPSGYIFGRTTFEYTSGVTGTIYLWFYGLSATPGNYILVDNISVKPAYYHGSFVDGVKCFNTDIAGNPLPTQYTYDAVTLNGVAGTYVSTPDSVALDITIPDVRVKAQLADWSPSGVNYALIARRNGTDGDYVFRVLTSGALGLYWYTSGGVFTSVSSSAAVSASANETLWVRFTRSGTAVNFFQSPDGVTWTSVGTEQTAASASTSGSSLAMYIGQTQDGADPLAGTIYRAQIYNGIDGTLAVDFDASRYAGGTTLTGSTGETWTLNGNAVIHPTNSPMLGYSAEGARTNLCLQSNAFTTAPWANQVGTVGVAQDIVGPDGAVSAWTFTDNDGAIAEVYGANVGVFTAASYTFSIFVAKTTGAQSSYPVVLMYDGTATRLAAATVDTSNGIATIWTSYTGWTAVGSATCVSFNDDFWRVSITFTASTNVWVVNFLPAGALTATLAGPAFDASATGSAVFYGAQVELGSFASSYIPTTTAAVTRNADVLTYSSAGNIDGTKGWCYAEVTLPNGVPGTQKTILETNAGIGDPLYIATTGEVSLYDQTAERKGVAVVSSTAVKKLASTWGGTSCLTAADGSVSAALGFDGNVGYAGPISVAQYNGGLLPLDGHIGPIYIGQRQLSASEMQAITS